MNTKNKIVKRIIIWAIVGIVLFFIPGEALSIFMINSVSADHSKYIKICAPLDDKADLSSYEDKEILTAVNVRAAMSPFFVGDNEFFTVEDYYMFVSKDGEYTLSEGSWSVAYKKDSPNDSTGPLHNGFALVSLDNAMKEGYLKTLIGYCSLPDDYSFRIDKYAIKNLVCYPLTITVLDWDNKPVETINCNPDADLSSYEVTEASDVYLSDLDLQSRILGMQESSGFAHQFAREQVSKLDFTKEINNFSRSAIPWRGTATTVCVSGDYAFVGICVANTATAFWILGLGLLVPWTIIMLIVILVTAKKNR